MGMCCALHSVSDANIERILSNPPLIWRLIAPDDPEIYLSTVRTHALLGFLRKLFGGKPVPGGEELPDLVLVEGEGLGEDLDKAWQGIHYCLNKTAHEARSPMDFITVGGEQVGRIEVGYGPARVIRSHVVKQILEPLTTATVESLRENYNPEKMEKLDIYPNIWVRDGEEAFEYIAEYFIKLRSFVLHCASHDLGMAIYLC